MKKFLALLMAALLICSLGSMAFAEDAKGSITVNGTTKDKVYDVYKIFDLTYSTTGEDESAETSVAYTIDPDWVNFFLGTSAPGAK